MRAIRQELGFNVIEINPGMDRGGAQVLRLVGEATQSRRLIHKVQFNHAACMHVGLMLHVCMLD